MRFGGLILLRSDLYPVTSAGRLVAIILMTFGVGVFGTLAAYISSTFINRAKNND
ncbi:MAG: ion channel [Minisyncoccia bacterium]